MLLHCACFLICAALAVAQNLPVPLDQIVKRESTATAEDRTFQARVLKDNPIDDIVLRPSKLRAPTLPYFYDIMFDAPCRHTKIKISVDTGSSDFWLDSGVWCKCDTRKQFPQWCNQVDTFQSKPAPDTLKYDDGHVVKGAFLSKDLIFGDKNLKNVTFLAAWDYSLNGSPDKTNDWNGLVGLGYLRNQQAQKTDRGKYLTLPYVLEAQGNTSSNAFSMWFKKTERGKGFEASILFGGYPKNYYKGDLTVFKMIKHLTEYRPSEILIRLDRLSFRGVDALTRCKDSLGVLLDTGSYSSWLPFDTFHALARSLGKYETDSNSNRTFAIFEDCSGWDLTEAVVFQFGNLKIPVPLSDIVRNVNQEEIESGRFPEIYDSKQCITHGIAAEPKAKIIARGLQGNPSDHVYRFILGVTFLRHAFILYDLPQEEVALAPIKQSALKNKAILTYFDDLYDHKGQGSYNPVEGVRESCSLTS
ncbi:hypothetical protein EKO04_008659 [Ascochyta lentis]|uniref:Peptidase A1 domain-containing protein n=1 Tax=Ascochyta lentis TaxID=205686 RepID=A0A8H7J183_9PLEO|nr:hypothetical protein EKO04_008659 [Ascochyta lentis]